MWTSRFWKRRGRGTLLCGGTALWRPLPGVWSGWCCTAGTGAYPADLYWDLSLEGWTLARREEFPGFSHEIITKEVYIP